MSRGCGYRIWNLRNKDQTGGWQSVELNVIVYLVLALLILTAAVKVVTTPNVMHAALYLAGTFVCVGAVYFLLSAEFLGAAQLLVYAGAITTIILFALMLSDAKSSGPRQRGEGRRFGFNGFVVASLFAALLLRIVLKVNWPAVVGYTRPDSIKALGKVLFVDYALPNEITSVILLVAMVGAIAISAKEEKK
jgi:NADH:ubiquinone oxidoreductase subunit 6 (subunit J)